MAELKLSTQRKSGADHAVTFKYFQLMPWIIKTIYHSLIYSINIYQVSTMHKAPVRTQVCGSQPDPSTPIRLTLHLRLNDFTGMSSFLLNFLYIVASTSIFLKYKSQIENLIQKS